MVLFRVVFPIFFFLGQSPALNPVVAPSCPPYKWPFGQIQLIPIGTNCSRFNTPGEKLECHYCPFRANIPPGIHKDTCPAVCFSNDFFYEKSRLFQIKDTCCYQLMSYPPDGYEQDGNNSASYKPCTEKSYNDGTRHRCQSCTFRSCLGEEICDPKTGKIDFGKCYMTYSVFVVVSVFLAVFLAFCFFFWRRVKSRLQGRRSRIEADVEQAANLNPSTNMTANLTENFVVN